MSAAAVDPALRSELELALLAELGARSIYPSLAAVARDGNLVSALGRMHQEQEEQVERLRGLMAGLGLRPRRRSVRRHLLARAFAASSRVLGLRLVLRTCVHAQTTAARWYAQDRDWFLARGDRGRALVCDDLATTKLRHAQVLDTWVRFARDRHG